MKSCFAENFIFDHSVAYFENKINVLKTISKIPEGKTFYASEYGFDGSTMSVLHNYTFITPVEGAEQEEFIRLSADLYKKVKVKGWKLARRPEEIKNALKEALSKYMELMPN